jgi:hypothetical protein
VFSRGVGFVSIFDQWLIGSVVSEAEDRGADCIVSIVREGAEQWETLGSGIQRSGGT